MRCAAPGAGQIWHWLGVTGGGITRAAMTHTLNAGAGAGQIGDASAKALMGSIGSAVRGAGVDAMTKNASLPGGKER